MGAAIPQFVGPIHTDSQVSSQLTPTTLGADFSSHSDLSSDAEASDSLSRPTATHTWDTFLTTSSESSNASTGSFSTTGWESTDDSDPAPQLGSPGLPNGLASNLTAVVFGHALFDAFDNFSGGAVLRRDLPRNPT